MARSLNLFRERAVGFIDWLGSRLLEPNFSLIFRSNVKRFMNDAIDNDYLVCGFAVRMFGDQIKSTVSAQSPPAAIDHVRGAAGPSAVGAKIV